VIANVRACTRLPPLNFHGKEGVTVRVRQRACTKALQMGMLCCQRWQDFESSRVRDGYILGLAGTRGHARRLATQRGTCSRDSITTAHPKNSCKHQPGVARAGVRLATSFAREGVAELGEGFH
jgi:hypothetical protein